LASSASNDADATPSSNNGAPRTLRQRHSAIIVATVGAFGKLDDGVTVFGGPELHAELYEYLERFPTLRNYISTRATSDDPHVRFALDRGRVAEAEVHFRTGLEQARGQTRAKSTDSAIVNAQLSVVMLAAQTPADTSSVAPMRCSVPSSRRARPESCDSRPRGVRCVRLPRNTEGDGMIIHTRHESPFLADNMLGDSDERSLFVYLPPGYAESDRRYATAYLLHAFGQSAESVVNPATDGERWRPPIEDVLDPVFGRMGVPPMIVVILDGNCRWGCGQWVDSPVSGQFGSYVAKDVVAFVDSTYRTIANARSRGVFGFSSGGMGA
jgi:hypothetical protein